MVAWEDKEASPPGSNSDVDRVMRYGVVIIGGSAEAGEGGGDDEDVPGGGDGKGSRRGGEGLRYVRVRLTPGKVDNLLSTQVCVCLCDWPFWRDMQQSAMVCRVGCHEEEGLSVVSTDRRIQ